MRKTVLNYQNEAYTALENDTNLLVFTMFSAVQCDRAKGMVLKELSHAKGRVKTGCLLMCDDTQDDEAFTNASCGLRFAMFATFGEFHVSGNDER